MYISKTHPGGPTQQIIPVGRPGCRPSHVACNHWQVRILARFWPVGHKSTLNAERGMDLYGFRMDTTPVRFSENLRTELAPLRSELAPLRTEF